MNNLHRELAPISDAAWREIDDEARRSFTGRVAARRTVDVPEPGGPTLAAVGTGHLRTIESPAEGVLASRREVQPLVELRVPFTVTREAIDDVERGAQDADWQPVKDAAARIARAEDRAVFHGAPEAGIAGIIPASSNAPVPLPDDVREMPAAVAQALNGLRLADVEGPYRLLLPADLYTAVAETTVHGYPILEHVGRILTDGAILWAPAVDRALLVSTRGGDYTLRLGQDLSVGYLSHDAERVALYLQETLTFVVATAEASVVIGG